MNVSNLTTPETILDFWFGSKPDDAVAATEQADLWWSKNKAMDDEIRRRFEIYVVLAISEQLNDLLSTPRGRLSLIILTDQFPRNIYRDTARAFSCDEKALTWCIEGLEQKIDRELRAIERVFFYLPLEHAEHLIHQDLSVKCFGELATDVPAEQKSIFEDYLNYAIRHREIIERFGRFPHRNKILGRESTPDELAFLAEPGSSF
ncbi:MAG: DUF924 domain-containing protein [Deltaproteobacteria bacterium]|nr:MAG: DUF924 domain-containing protein [Deltaproteobacteria bacterium]